VTARLLCIGDIHLGRRPARLAERVLERLGAAELGPAAAWRRAIDEALERRVDGVLLAGDVVEQNDDFYEAYGDLAEGVEQLTSRGIPVLAVAGNHDVEVLPRLADSIAGFRLLGRGGVWETAAIGAREAAIEVLGWSFPEREVRASPLAGGLPGRERHGVPRIGLLHCDRDQSGSRYAPVRSRELEAAPVDAWLLGHIHRPDPLDALEPPIGYLGSLVGLGPGEPGAHGPWLVEIEGGRLRLRHLPIAPLRWEALEVPLDELAGPADVHRALVAAIDRLHERLAAEPCRPRALGCRLRLTGRTPHRRAIEQALAAASPEELLWPREETLYFVERWVLAAQPAIDLEALAAGADPPALIARELLALREGRDAPERRVLVDEARRRFEALVATSVFAPLEAAVPDEDAIAAVLEQAALGALDELLAERDAPR